MKRMTKAHWNQLEPDAVKEIRTTISLTSTQLHSLNEAIARLEAGYSIFDLHIHPRIRTPRQIHAMEINAVFSKQSFPVYTRQLDHSPG